MQPRPRHGPLPLNGSSRQAYHGRDLFLRQAAEELHFHDVGLARVHAGEPIETLVDGEHEAGLLIGQKRRSVKLDIQGAAAAFDGVTRAGVIHQDTAHYTACQGEEMGSALPVDIALTDETEIDFIDQHRRLHTVAWALAAKASFGHFVQIGVDSADQLGFHVSIAFLETREQAANVGSGHVGTPYYTDVPSRRLASQNDDPLQRFSTE